jgi:hypothetical protein
MTAPAPGPNQPSQATPSYPAPGGGGYVQTALGVTGTQVLKKGAGAVIRAVVSVAGSAAGGVFDCTATANAATATQVAVIPNTVGNLDLEFPVTVGVFVQLGNGQVVSFSYE